MMRLLILSVLQKSNRLELLFFFNSGLKHVQSYSITFQGKLAIKNEISCIRNVS